MGNIAQSTWKQCEIGQHCTELLTSFKAMNGMIHKKWELRAIKTRVSI